MQGPAASELLAEAQAAHAAGKIDAAIASARQALNLNPGFIAALTYLGTTLATRKLAFAEGLAMLEKAVALAPEDAGAHYSLGWCYEFVAYRLEKQITKPYRSPTQLYVLAAEELRRCIGLEPEQGLLEDAQDLLASIEARL